MRKIIPQERTCLICPTTFLVGGAGNGKYSQQYCSWACRSIAKINTNSKKSAILTDNHANYLAGVLDSDGHIGIYAHVAKANANKNYRIYVDIVNSYYPLLEFVKNTTEVGSIVVQNKGTDKRKPTWYWSCISATAASVLEQLLPYMIVKRDRAELALDFQKRCMDPVLKADKTWQHEYREQMLVLNKRGPEMSED